MTLPFRAKFLNSSIMLMRGFLQFDLNGCAGQSGSKGYAIESRPKRQTRCVSLRVPSMIVNSIANRARAENRGQADGTRPTLIAAQKAA
jgi:hypothetical protein